MAGRSTDKNHDQDRRAQAKDAMCNRKERTGGTKLNRLTDDGRSGKKSEGKNEDDLLPKEEGNVLWEIPLRPPENDTG